VTVVFAPDLVLAFWFGDAGRDAASYAERMRVWFDGSEALDQRIARDHAVHVTNAAAGAYDEFTATARGTLALLILLDQFPRHIHRGSADAFRHDARAREVCLAGLARGLDRELHPIERQFFYLPLQHAESVADQARCVALFEALLEETPGESFLRPHFKHALDIAKFHAQVIARYGRYPHRNRVLGRPDTLAERMYLDAGGPVFGQVEPARETAVERAPEFRMYSVGMDPSETLCVDGNVFGLRCLSHWPGSVVPPELSHELSTGMALRHARMSRAERERVLGRFSCVTNDHYDTDGALAAFALISPEVAFEHADLMLAAAATGDFRTFQGEAALALDLTVWALRDSPRSPLRERLAALEDADLKAELCYRFLLAELPALLADPFKYRALLGERFAQVMADIRAVEAGQDLRVQHFAEHDLSVLHVERPFTRHGLVHASADTYRVLVVQHGAEGARYRFFYRNESWFLGARERAAPRLALDAVVSMLNELEGAGEAHWWCQPLAQTSPELGFGFAAAPPNVFGDIRPDRDPCSRLKPHQVVQALIATLSSSRSTAPAGARPAQTSGHSELP
jgi:uncharacterized protein (DUF924 family)